MGKFKRLMVWISVGFSFYTLLSFYTGYEKGYQSTLPKIEVTTATPISKEDALAEQRKAIEDSMQNYNYSREKNMSNYIMENGGMSIRNIIWTTWRSGSTFLGEAIASHPATFYHFEPLMYFKIMQVGSGPLAQEGLHVMRSLLECNYSDLKEYLDFGMEHVYQHNANLRLWPSCQKNRELCGDSDFLSKSCKSYPFQLLKSVRMRLNLAESLLQDEKLDVRILFLVRDPRGVIQSRIPLSWCHRSADCIDPAQLCSDMVQDYHAAAALREKYPEKLLMVRFEDLAMYPYTGVKHILNFFRLQHHPLVSAFLENHTGNRQGDMYSTYRNSKTIPFGWIDYFMLANNTDELNHIQKVCSEAIRLWGYADIDIKKGNGDVMPLLQPPWLEMTIPKSMETNVS